MMKHFACIALSLLAFIVAFSQQKQETKKKIS